jgi:hypothetical protein
MSHKNLPRLTVPGFIEYTENPLAIAQNACARRMSAVAVLCISNGSCREWVVYDAFPQTEFPI